jgi:hypothetical protein
MNKKGQAAMEFLMTYGWAILVVIAAIAALAYFGVLDPGRLLPERCQSSAGMDCVDKAVITTQGITVALRNNVGFDIDVTAVDVPGSSCTAELFNGAAQDPDQANVSNNDVFRVGVGGCAWNSGDKFDDVLVVNYTNSETRLDHAVRIDIRGKVA